MCTFATYEICMFECVHVGCLFCFSMWKMFYVTSHELLHKIERIAYKTHRGKNVAIIFRVV